MNKKSNLITRSILLKVINYSLQISLVTYVITESTKLNIQDGFSQILTKIK